MATVPTTDVVLEPGAKEFAEATANPRYLFDLPVERYQGDLPRLVMLNALRDTHAADAAIKQAVGFLSEALGTR